jgi:hypothetical protein
MIQDMTLRWVVTLLYVCSAAVCVQTIVANRHSAANVISHSLHAIMAVAMAVMAWPRGAELPPRAPMIFFLVAALWFAVSTARVAGHRAANVYHSFMMLAMSWMYAAMGGLNLPKARDSASMAGMDGMPGMPGMDGSSGHEGHGGHAGHGGHGAGDSGAQFAAWVGTLNWMCTIGFTVAAVFWLYRLITERLQSTEDRSHSTVGILCQLAMAAGMAIMFGVML